MHTILRVTQPYVNTLCGLRFAQYADSVDNANMAPNEIDREKVGAVIRSIRKHRKLTQADLADAAGTDTGNISRLERGKQGHTDTTLSAIATRLSVSAAYIYTLAEQKTETYEPETTPDADQEIPLIKEIPIVGKIIRNEDGVVMIKQIKLGSKKVYSKDIDARCYVEDSSAYEPRVRVNELVIVEPNSEITTEKDVLIQMIDGTCLIRQFISDDGEYYRVNDVNYHGQRERISKKQVEIIERIGGYIQPD